jgi:hypothetical protein
MYISRIGLRGLNLGFRWASFASAPTLARLRKARAQQAERR